MVYCTSCGTANRDGSRFCNDCGAKLPSVTSARCPQCGTPNSPHSVFCEKCGTRLVPTLADDTPEPEPNLPVKKGLSLPTKPEAGAAPINTDWLGNLRSSMEPTAADEPSAAPQAELPEPDDQADWLARLTDYVANPTRTAPRSGASVEPATPAETVVAAPSTAPADVSAPQAEPGEVPDWLTSLGIIAPADSNPSAADEDVPEWLRQIPLMSAASAEETGPSQAPIESAPEPADWSSSLRDATPAAHMVAPDEDVPDWLRSLGTGPLPSSASDQPAAPADWLNSLRVPDASTEVSPEDEDIPDWLRTLGTGPLPSAVVEPPAPPVEKTPPTPASPADESDWLGSLRAAAPPIEPETPTEPPAPVEELPDWLRNLGATDQAQRSADALPDWLDSMSSQSPVAESSADQAETPAEDDVPAWLRDLGASAEIQPAAQRPEVASSTSEAADWLSDLRATASQPAESAEAPIESAPAEELPDWLQSIGLPVTAQAAPPVADESADWMSSLRASASQPAESAETPIESAPAEDVPDWLQSVGLPVTAQAAPPVADESADWMSSLRASASQPAESAEMPIESAPAEDVPDWLQSIGLPVTDQAVPPAADESADWMSSLRATTSQPAESAETPIESAPAEDVPDWLRDPGATQTQPVALTEQQAETPVAEEGPDWLRAFDASPSEPAASVPSTIESAPAEVPDWLRDIGATAAAQPPAVESDDLPDWLRDTGAATQPADTSAVPTFDLSAEAEPAAETPDWLSNLQPPIKTEPAASESSKSETSASPAMAAAAGLGTAGPIGVDKTPERDLPAAELPDWLKSLREGQPAAFIPSAEPMSGLLQAEIPTWLEALRPKEGQAGSLADLPAESEQEGVFAGLANILPPLSDLTETSAATPVTTVTSADDLARAGIFQELLSRPISQPTLVAALPAQSRQGQGRLLQWVIALLLVAVIVAPFLMPQGWLPFLPHADNLPPSPLVQSAVTKITILPPNASVLVVFDYDPTQAGEMNQIAEMVLRHLQTRAANVTAVSLNPLGADLALSVWSAIGAPTGGRRINLGYVPGQAIGVQNVLLNNGPFSLVIDLSASSDSVRWWVEQLAVSGFDVPFIAGVSAAVESLALPYAQSGQITGLISGATGAMMYARQANLLPSLEEAQQAMLMAEQTQQPPSPEVVLMVRNQYHIESQTLAHWLLAVLIIMGLVSGLVSRAGRRSAP